MTVHPSPHSRFYLGLDLSQARDFSAIAIAIAERRLETTGRNPVTFAPETSTRVIVHHLERIPLRTPYPQVVDLSRTSASSSKVSSSPSPSPAGAPARRPYAPAPLK